jgi:hypothetical protein
MLAETLVAACAFVAHEKTAGSTAATASNRLLAAAVLKKICLKLSRSCQPGSKFIPHSSNSLTVAPPLHFAGFSASCIKPSELAESRMVVWPLWGRHIQSLEHL